MAVNQQRKIAMKRLMSDLNEVRKSPVANVSAVPLESNMLEWHCNFLCDGTVYHLILFFPENYPFKSPSAEFVPAGFNYRGGATKPGRKGTQVCLSIFSDFAEWHREWADEKNAGWSPGYTVQTVLLNMLSFLAEIQGDCTYNASLTKNFKCADCGHTDKKPFPPLDENPKEAKNKNEADKREIVCYISKEKLGTAAKPKSNEELFGYGLIQSGPVSRPSFTSPCEFLSAHSFFSMKKSVGVCHSIMKEPLSLFLPLFLHLNHGSAIQDQFEKTMKEAAVVLPKCNPKKTPMDDMVIKTIPNMMSATVVEFSKGTQHTSDNHLCGYFALHRLLLWAIQTYPELQGKIDERLKVFIENEDQRSKKACPHIGEWLMLLSASSKYRWQDAAEAYLSESWKRNVMWFVKEDAKLGHFDTEKKYRLDNTLMRTAVSRKILAFQVLFLDIAMPKGMSQKDLMRRYDDNSGFPTPEMVTDMKIACQKIETMKTYTDWFNVLKLDPPSDDVIYWKLMRSLNFAIETNGYHWTFWKNAGGWMTVLKKYEADKKSGKVKQIMSGDILNKADGGPGKGKGKGKGKGSKSEKDEEEMEVEAPKVGAAKGRGKSSKVDGTDGTGKGKGRGKGVKIPEIKVEEKPKAKAGRGRGKGAKAVAEEKVEIEAAKVSAGRGRSKRKAADDKDEEPKAKVARGGRKGRR